jgi:hypothetical protein
MRFDRKKDPAACAAKAGSRYAVTGVAVVEYRGRPWLAATDGHALTMIHVDPEDDPVVPVRVYPTEAFKAARTNYVARLELNGSAKVAVGEGVADFPRCDDRFPDVAGVIIGDEPAQSIVLDAETLARMQKAFGADAVKLSFYTDDKGRIDTSPMRVEPVKGKGKGEIDGSFGMMMPVC